MTAKRRLVHNHSTDEVRDGPPSRRAKIAALNGIAAHLKRNDQGLLGPLASLTHMLLGQEREEIPWR